MAARAAPMMYNWLVGIYYLSEQRRMTDAQQNRPLAAIVVEALSYLVEKGTLEDAANMFIVIFLLVIGGFI